MLRIQSFPPTKVVSPPKRIDESEILGILEQHIVDYHQPPAITTNALIGTSLEKLVSALKGEKPDLTIHEEVEEGAEEQQEGEQDTEMPDVEFGTEAEGEGDGERAALTEKPKIDKEKRKREKKERLKEEKRRRLEEKKKGE